ncbi:ribokinase [Actinomycetospora sp. NBRC 106375]|uniref:PfkB family carbohydrate kinase n=1 Tax=Actinomycetospora sp. NBRC 106375 TaxID=3032207 RepID=UPI0024A14FAD|nr:PfkB family carbohydrate kinase [Actinomycetospora sp. NBRC 106375]GLZ47979.1 ribokinase [Actinomycetospora sp. NBRC 106375]
MSRPGSTAAPSVSVVGSVNLDLVARVERLPAPGETLSAHGVTRVPGGKGANQALAAARLGARVRLHAAVGDDPLAGEALALLRDGGVDLSAITIVDRPTGTAMIQVDDDGDTTIVIDPGANDALVVHPGDLRADVVLTVLEVPDEAVATAMASPGYCVLNAAPARAVPGDVLAGVDLLCVNAAEHGVLAAHADLDALRAVAVTHGEAGAELRRRGRIVARAEPPPIDAVDGTAAGDAFTAALALALATEVDDVTALRRACRAGALAATRAGAQPSLPTLGEIDVP